MLPLLFDCAIAITPDVSSELGYCIASLFVTTELKVYLTGYIIIAPPSQRWESDRVSGSGYGSIPVPRLSDRDLSGET